MPRPKGFHLSLILMAVLCLALGGLVMAQDSPPPEGPPPDGRAARDPGADQKAFEGLLEEYRAKVAPIHDDYIDQRLIYKAIAGRDEVSLAEVKKVVAEMRRLRDLLSAEREGFRRKLAEAGLEAYGPGPGHGPLGGGCAAFDGSDPGGRGGFGFKGHHRGWGDEGFGWRGHHRGRGYEGYGRGRHQGWYDDDRGDDGYGRGPRRRWYDDDRGGYDYDDRGRHGRSGRGRGQDDRERRDYD